MSITSFSIFEHVHQLLLMRCLQQIETLTTIMITTMTIDLNLELNNGSI